MKQTKIYNVNHFGLFIEIVGFLIPILGCVYAYEYFLVSTLRYETYFLLCIALLVIRLVILLFPVISKIEFDENILTIKYLLFRKKNIDFSTIKDYSVFRGFQNINLYYIDNRKPDEINLLFFNIDDREKISYNIFEIMKGYFENYSEEQLDKFYEDKTQYDFTAIEKHNPFILFLIIFVGFITLVTILVIILTLFVIKPKEGLFSIIEEWFIHINLISIIVVFVLDKLVTKKTLECRNSIITLYKNQKTIHSFIVGTINEYFIYNKEFIWTTKQNPKKKNVINIMGFSRKDKKELRNKLVNLIPLHYNE